MDREIPFRFDAEFDAASFTPTSDPTLRVGRVRVFYKHLNRNGSFITDKFATKLALSAYGKPLVGTYDRDACDFKGHETPEEAKAYGFVLPGSLSWEDHEDSDGVTRNYATYDVVVWSEYWDEAKTIFTKTQSMELDRNSIQGAWKDIIFEGNDEYAFVYSDAIMAGLCILGNAKTPCFEGAAFFSTEDDSYKKFSMAIQKYFENGGMNAMENLNEEVVVEEQLAVEEEQFTEEQLAEEQPATEEEAPVVEEEPAVEEPAAEEESVVEEPAVEEQPAEEEPSVPAEPEKDYAAMYSDLKAQYETLTSELADLRSQYASLEEEKNNLVEEYESLKVLSEGYKTDITAQHSLIEKYENEEKERIIAKFSGRLPADIVSQIEEAKETMTIDEMNTRFAMEYTSFSMAREQNEEIRVPQLPQEEPSALARILKNYKR